ncbi:MAG: hypothetical protein KKB82_06790 [Candidatus Omnitrophica bacterium]|nr:hypothetical protein [Candidatus Omnitrophota bacterium]MBU1925609.1 hypothetical protein [Candidatus Omnitrophota bacterium]
MKKKSSTLFGAVYTVCKLLFISIVAIILITSVFFKVALDVRSYDVAFIQRLTPDTYYGIILRDKFEIWKVNEQENGGITEQRIYPF